MAKADTPHYIGPTIGWRTWILRTDHDPPRPGVWSVSTPGETDQLAGAGGDGRFRLTSGAGTIWLPHKRLTAQCGAGQDHPAPDLKCSCGIYAARSHRILREMGYAAGPDDSQAPDLVGELWLWGRMMESSEILRAEFAYPKRLYLPHLRWRWAEPLRQTYGVPVEIKNVFTMEVT